MLRCASEKPWFEVAAIVDVDADAVAKAQSGFPGAQAFCDLTTALAETRADAVLVNTPSEHHHALSKEALDAGHHVLVAKPIANDFDEAYELVELADAKGVTLCVGQQMRFMRHYRAVRRFVGSGRLGSVEVINFLNPKPRPNPLNLARLEQPALHELSCHHFDSLLAVVPQYRPAVDCVRRLSTFVVEVRRPIAGERVDPLQRRLARPLSGRLLAGGELRAQARGLRRCAALPGDPHVDRHDDE